MRGLRDGHSLGPKDTLILAGHSTGCSEVRAVREHAAEAPRWAHVGEASHVAVFFDSVKPGVQSSLFNLWAFFFPRIWGFQPSFLPICFIVL